MRTMVVLSLVVLVLSCTSTDNVSQDTGVELDPAGVDLANWKITFPIRRDGSTTPGYPAAEEYFYPRGDNWVFQCVYTRVTTSQNTKYSRTELREMRYKSDSQKDWRMSEGATMEGTLKAIWDSGTIRLLTKTRTSLDSDLWRDREFGTYREAPYDHWTRLKIVISGTTMTVYKVDNGSETPIGSVSNLEDVWSRDNTFYFKAGNYLQHGSSIGAQKSKVEFSYLSVSHQ